MTKRGSRRSCTMPPKRDRKSTRLNSSHLGISYAVFCLKKKYLFVVVPWLHQTVAPSPVRVVVPTDECEWPDTCIVQSCIVLFFNNTATTEIYPLSLHDALPI